MLQSDQLSFYFYLGVQAINFTLAFDELRQKVTALNIRYFMKAYFYEYINGCVDEWMNAGMKVMDGQRDEKMNGQVDGEMKEKIK